MQRLKFEKVYLDTNAIIHAVENYSHVAREILRAGQRGEISLFTSAITLHETMIGPLARGSVCPLHIYAPHISALIWQMHSTLHQLRLLNANILSQKMQALMSFYPRQLNAYL